MLINHEVPIKCCSQASFNEYGYALAHNFNNPDYKEYFVNLSKTQEVYLDNSAFELGESVPSSFLNECVAALDYKCRVFLPDVLGNAKETVKRSIEYASNVKCETWAVVQGRDLDEQTWCFKQLRNITDHIALPYGCVDRPKFIECNLKDLKDTKIHLLGLKTMHELVKLKHIDNIYSIDTSLPVVLGLKGIKLDIDSNKDSTPVWDFDVDTLPDLVYENALTFKKFLRG